MIFTTKITNFFQSQFKPLKIINYKIIFYGIIETFWSSCLKCSFLALQSSYKAECLDSALSYYMLWGWGSNPSGCIKRTSSGGIKLLTSGSEERGGGEWTHIHRFYFNKLMWSV
jgi:hypothetical protein